jgi:Uma2 family endonuclease
MLNYENSDQWPSGEELPDPEEKFIDNELQELIPGLLKSILLIIWADRMDWLFGIDMGIYYHPDEPPVVPEGFLSLGIERFYHEEMRSCYAVWEEKAMPSLVLEIVSQNYRQEYTKKFEEYQNLGILYSVFYAFRRRRRARLEVYKLINGQYELQPENPVWMPEIGLGIGCERGNYSGVTREWLYWYDADGKRYLTPEEQVKKLTQRTENLAQRLRELGEDPDNLN